MRRHYVKLKGATETCQSTVADQMYSKDLINQEVRDKPSFEKFEKEFLNCMSLLGCKINEIEQNCKLFLLCIASAGGPAKNAAISLAKEWESQVTVGRSFFVGYKFREFCDFLKIRENYFRINQILTVQDGRRHKFTKIKSAKLILRQIREIYSPRKKGALRYSTSPNIFFIAKYGY